MQHVSPRYLLPPFISSLPNIQNGPMMQSEALPEKEMPMITEEKDAKIEVEEPYEEEEMQRNSGPDDDYKIDKLFYRICYFCFIVGVNFYRDRSVKLRALSMAIVAWNCSINMYLMGYVSYLTLAKPFEANRVATSITVCCWILQATLSTIFLGYWQYTSQPCNILKILYEANKGIGINHHRKSLVKIVHTFYVVLAFIVFYYAILIAANFAEIDIGYADEDIPHIFGDRRLFVIVQLADLYCILCWGVALFIFTLLVHATNCEFTYYNEQVRSLLPRGRRQSLIEPVCGCDHSVDHECTVSHDEIKCNYEYQSDEMLCNYLLKLIKIHNRLTECVKRLDRMFNRYAFVMISTIIPTTIFSLFMVVHQPASGLCWELLFSCPLVFFCVFSFFALVNTPSELHNTIYNTKSELCANTHIWFPYRPNVYHSALAFVCHLDQTNLGISIWGFAVVSKPLVLTTLSVMVTMLALFLQVGDCNSNNQPMTTTTTMTTF